MIAQVKQKILLRAKSLVSGAVYANILTIQRRLILAYLETLIGILIVVASLNFGKRVALFSGSLIPVLNSALRSLPLLSGLARSLWMSATFGNAWISGFARHARNGERISSDGGALCL